MRATLAQQQNGTAFAVTLMEHLAVPTFVLDAEQRVLVWNKACERLTDVRAVDVIGTREHWRAFYERPRPCLADLVATHDETTIDKLYTTYQEPGAPVLGVHAENWCMMPRRGQRLYLAVDAGPVYDADGKLLAVVETLRDITEIKLAESRVQEQASTLREMVDAQQRENELARRIVEHQVRGDLMREAGVQYSVQPATNFSGDIVLAARARNGKLYAILADATGHGLAAAVSVLPIVQEFYRLVELSESLATIVESLNFLLINSLPLGRFVAAALVCVDQQAGHGEVWVGGVPSVLLLGEDGAVLRKFSSRHLPLGISRDREDLGAPQAFFWEAESQLLMLSDGVAEAADPSGQPYGEARLIEALAAMDGRSLIDAVSASVQAHLQGQAAHDDISLLVIDCPAPRG